MWQKINRWLIRQVLIAPLPIFAKMVLLYSAIVFFILLTVSVATLTSIHYIMNNALRDQLMDNAEAAVHYLDTYGKVDTTIFVQANLPPQMNLQIYDGAGHLIIDNGPTHAVRKLSDRYIDDAISTPEENPLPTKVQGNEASGFSYYRLWTNKQGMNYYLRFSQRPDKETNFISLLSKQLLASILISLILTIVTGMYFMKKSLAPLKVINDTVKTIEVNRLDNRIALSDNKNELHDLAVTINQALDRIEYGYKKQQHFISEASHELRTPITVIAGYADLLDRWGKEDPAVLNEGLTAIKSETDYMKQLTERLLFFARSNNGTLIKHFTEIDTAQLLQEVYSEITLIDKEHDIRLTDNDKAVIIAEPGSVKQMLRIFIDNAIKYTPAGKQITLSCRADEKEVIYRIADTGIGIPEKDLNHVFERFYRVDSSRTKATGGSGLGLSIAQYIAKANKAEITLKSKVHEGTTVSVIFPLKNGDKNLSSDSEEATRKLS